jgi:hypothetical protein
VNRPASRPDRVWLLPLHTGGLRVPLTADEIQRVERVIAVGRVFMAGIAFVVGLLSPAPLGLNRLLAHALLFGYLVQSVLVLTLVRVRKESTPEFRFAVHAVDLVWAAAATMIVHESSGLFLLFLVFTLVAAAYRWGLRETLGTALWAILFLGAGNELLARPLIDTHELTMQSAYLLIFGLLLGYLAEEDKQLRSEGAIIGRLLARVQDQRALGETLKVVAAELEAIFAARGLIFVLQALEDQRTFVWSFSADHVNDADGDRIRPTELSPSDSEIYGFTPLGQTWHAVSGSLRSSQVWRCAPWRPTVAGRAAFASRCPKPFCGVIRVARCCRLRPGFPTNGRPASSCWIPGFPGYARRGWAFC